MPLVKGNLVKQKMVNAGRFLKAPENFLNQAGIKTVFSEAKNGRRDFIRRAFAEAAASAAMPAAMAQNSPVASADGDVNILNLAEHSKGLGQGVSAAGSYGAPSKYECSVLRRQSPGLTQTTQSSVSFAPLQPLFGIITPGGLHFEQVGINSAVVSPGQPVTPGHRFGRSFRRCPPVCRATRQYLVHQGRLAEMPIR